MYCISTRDIIFRRVGWSRDLASRLSSETDAQKQLGRLSAPLFLFLWLVLQVGLYAACGDLLYGSSDFVGLCPAQLFDAGVMLGIDGALRAAVCFAEPCREFVFRGAEFVVHVVSPSWRDCHSIYMEVYMSTVNPITGEISDVTFEEGEAVGRRKIFRTSIERFLDKLAWKRQTLSGAEQPDPTPIAPPIGYVKQPTMVEHMRAMIRSESLRMAAEAAGAETFEEADDFEVDDDLEPISAYEFERFFEPPAESRPAAEADRPPEPEAPDQPAKPAPVAPAPSPSA